VPNAIGEWQAEHDLDDEAMADLMSERLGKAVSLKTYRTAKYRSNDRIPKSYLRALSIQESDGFTGPDSDAPGLRDDDLPPGSPPAPEPQKTGGEIISLDWASTRSALIMIYGSIGVGVSHLLSDPVYAKVLQKAAPMLADDWLALAKVHPATAAFLRKLTLGGPGGKLLADHVTVVYALVIRRTDDGYVIPKPKDTPIPADGAGLGADSVRSVA
jgi:hypothetical protein